MATRDHHGGRLRRVVGRHRRRAAKVKYLVATLPFSNAYFAKAYPVERLLDGIESAFRWFGGVVWVAVEHRHERRVGAVGGGELAALEPRPGDASGPSPRRPRGSRRPRRQERGAGQRRTTRARWARPVLESSWTRPGDCSAGDRCGRTCGAVLCPRDAPAGG